MTPRSCRICLSLSWSWNIIISLIDIVISGLYVDGLMMSLVNCSLIYAYALGVQYLSAGDARSSLCAILISLSGLRWPFAMLSR